MFSLQKVQGYETQRDIKDLAQKRQKMKFSLTFCLDAENLGSMLTEHKS